MIKELPDSFITQMRNLLGDDSDKFIKAMQEPPAVSIKINRRKTHTPDICGYEDLTPVKWCESGFYLPKRPVFTLNPLIHAGVFYVQDASSMIYEAVTKKIVSTSFNTRDSIRVLDMCAAPGGKTTSMINALPDGTMVVANEFISARATILTENLMKWGYPDIIVTNSPTGHFAGLGELFDIIAVDAPCSGEGMMRKEEVAISQWGEGLQKQCASLQREILNDAFSALKPGGFMIYSTCTFNRLENEENVRYLVEDLGMATVNMHFPEEWGISDGIDTPYPCLRFMPHITQGEGLFISVLRKEGDYIPSRLRKGETFSKTISSKVIIIADGIPMTVTKGKDLVPTTESVLSTAYNKGKLPETELDENTALSYLRHEAIKLDPEIPKGHVVVMYKGKPLGIVKNLGNRANNLYPAQWRIRMK